MDDDCVDLLRAWGFESYIPVFVEQKIDSAALSLLTEELTKELIKPIGDRAKFWSNLQQWRSILSMANDTNLMNDVSLTHIVQDSGQSTSTPTESSELQVHYSGQSTSTPTNSCEPQVQDSGESTSTPTNNSELQSTEILNLLKSCNDGKALLLNETLDNSSRNKLCDLIITFELKNDPNAVISSARLMNLANQIVSIFKKEHKSTYFIPYINYNAQKKAAKGKLLNSLHKLRRKYRKLGLINSRRSSASSSTSTSSSKTLDWSDVWNSEDCPEPSDDIKNKLRWLTNSTTPLETVQTYWKETAECRIKTQMKSNKSISEYIAEYPALKKPTGYVLLMEDFGYMYPEKVDCLTSEFPLYKDKILQLGRKKSDINIKAILNKLEENNNPDLIEELSSYTAFCVLPYLLTPHTITKGKDAESGKKTWRPSRSEMKDGFITEVACVGDLKKTVSDRKENLSRFGHNLQPFIISIPHVGGNNDYYVVIEDFMFMFKNVLSAVDCCFKCIHALNAQYPAECFSLWFLIQKGFYKLKTPWDKRYIGVNSLLCDLGITVTD